MEIGKDSLGSPIVYAILEAELETAIPIRVYLSQSWIGGNVFQKASQILLTESKTLPHGILIYVNLRRRKYALVGDQNIYQTLGQNDWENITKELKENLRSTQYEKAIALTVLSLGQNLKRHFPAKNVVSNAKR